MYIYTTLPNINNYILFFLIFLRPSTFSGQRALNFVLDNQNLIDKTLLINIRLIRVDKDYKGKA